MFSIHHVALAVQDLNRSIDFYKQFGFSSVVSYRNEEVNVEHLSLDGFVLELFQYPEMTALPEFAHNLDSDLATIGTKHFALQVDNIHDAYALMQNNQVEIVTEIKEGRTGITYFFIKDPDGILVEIVQA